MSEDLELAETFDYYSGIAVANLGIKEYESSATDNKISEWKDGEKCKDHPCIKMTNEAKKSFLFVRKLAGWNFFYHLPARISRTHKQKSFHSQFKRTNIRFFHFK